jgi:hypothetical protein
MTTLRERGVLEDVALDDPLKARRTADGRCRAPPDALDDDATIIASGAARWLNARWSPAPSPCSAGVLDTQSIDTFIQDAASSFSSDATRAILQQSLS